MLVTGSAARIASQAIIKLKIKSLCPPVHEGESGKGGGAAVELGWGDFADITIFLPGISAALARVAALITPDDGIWRHRRGSCTCLYLQHVAAAAEATEIGCIDYTHMQGAACVCVE